MKKFILTICFLLAVMVSFPQWSGLSTNQLVTFHNLKNAVTNGVFVQRISIPDNTRVVKKADVINYVVLDETNSYLSAKSSNQLIAKRDLTPGSSYTLYNLYYQSYSSPTFYGWSTCASAGTSGGVTEEVYADGPMNVVGTKLYGNSFGGSSLLATGQWYYVASLNYAIQVSVDGAGVATITHVTCSGLLTDVYLWLQYSYGPAGTVSISVGSYTSAAHSTTINVDANVVVTYRITDDQGTTYSAETITLSSGTNFISQLSYVSNSAIGVYVEIIDVSPTTSSTQSYITI